MSSFTRLWAPFKRFLRFPLKARPGRKHDGSQYSQLPDENPQIVDLASEYGISESRKLSNEKQQMIDETSEIIVDAKTLVDPHEQRLQTFRAIQAEDLAHLKAVLKDFYPRTTTVGPAKRMRTELLNFIESEEQHSNISISPIGNDATRLLCTILGPLGTPHESGIFSILVEIPDNYPFKPMTCHFKTPTYHPNIDSHGLVHVDILECRWSPVLTVPMVLMSLCSFLDDPNPFTPARHDVASVYINDPCAYEAGVRQGVEMFAVGMRPAKEELEKGDEEEN